MRIGELAETAGVPTRTIRFHERKGSLREPHRAANGRAPCAHVDALLHCKLDEVRDRRRRLAQLETELEALVDRSRTLDPAHCREGEMCHIVEVLASAISRPLIP